MKTKLITTEFVIGLIFALAFVLLQIMATIDWAANYWDINF